MAFCTETFCQLRSAGHDHNPASTECAPGTEGTFYGNRRDLAVFILTVVSLGRANLDFLLKEVTDYAR